MRIRLEAVIRMIGFKRKPIGCQAVIIDMLKLMTCIIWIANDHATIPEDLYLFVVGPGGLIKPHPWRPIKK